MTQQGNPFWKALEDDGVESWIMRMPVNFPPSGFASRELTGMGTPELTGSLGEFSFFTSAQGCLMPGLYLAAAIDHLGKSPSALATEMRGSR